MNAEVVRIDDPDDDRLADYLRLTDRELRRGDTFLCESVLVIRRAVDAGVQLRSMLVTDARLADLGDLATTAYVVSQELMNRVTGINLHRGAIAAALRPPERKPADVLTGRTVAVLEGLNDLENVGVIFRTAAAFAIEGVLIDERTADPLHRRCVRVSLGHALAVPWARGTLADIRAAGYEIVALTPDPSAEPVDVLDDLDRVALCLGAEGPGLTTATLEHADRRVRIPITGGVDSLNVATAAAVAFHHRFRGG